MHKLAQTVHELHPLVRDRWSPRAFAAREIPTAALGSLFEAARWAPSCFNEQPWRFVVAVRQDESEFARMLSCLTEPNQRWAQHAGALMISVASGTFARNGKANRFAAHDVGLAVGQLTLQATNLGLAVHQMGGFSQERAREQYAIPEAFEPIAAIAVGYPGEASDLPDDLRERELTPRERQPLEAMVFESTWGRARSLGSS